MEAIVFRILASVIRSQKNNFRVDKNQDLINLKIEYHSGNKVSELPKLKVDKTLIKHLWSYRNTDLQKIQDDIKLFYAFPNIETIKKFWNITETNVFKSINSLKFQKIGINLKFFVEPSFLNSAACLVDSQYSKYIKVCNGLNELRDKKILPKDILQPDFKKLRIRLLHFQKYNLK